MMFRSAMCPSCDNLLKIDSNAETVFCSRCGSQMGAEDAFVYYELKTSGVAELSNLEGYNMLITCGTSLLEQKKHDGADSCFRKILIDEPEDYAVWRLRAMTWESRVVFEFKSQFYLYDDTTKEVVENKDYLSVYKELCNNAVRHSPEELSHTLAEEFNNRIRGHFNIALKAFKKEKQKRRLLQTASVLGAFILILILFRNCSGA